MSTLALIGIIMVYSMAIMRGFWRLTLSKMGLLNLRPNPKKLVQKKPTKKRRRNRSSRRARLKYSRPRPQHTKDPAVLPHLHIKMLATNNQPIDTFSMDSDGLPLL